MSAVNDLQRAVERMADIRKRIAIAMKRPEAARKELAGAMIGHKNWNGYGLDEVRDADLHRRAIDAVTDYLIADLTECKRAEISALADELDATRKSLPDLAASARFELLDDVVAARTWRGE